MTTLRVVGTWLIARRLSEPELGHCPQDRLNGQGRAIGVRCLIEGSVRTSAEECGYIRLSHAVDRLEKKQAQAIALIPKKSLTIPSGQV